MTHSPIVVAEVLVLLQLLLFLFPKEEEHLLAAVPGSLVLPALPRALLSPPTGERPCSG